jgi:hypothetical protein
MDNLRAHKIAAVRAASAAADAQLILLPPYSPDMNPIEMAFAKLKTCSVRCRSGLATAWQRIGALSTCSLPRNSLAVELAVHLLVGLGFLERGDLRLGEQDAILRRLGLKRLQAMLHRGQIVALPHAAHPRRRDR